jgi:hypothetical protein
MMVENKIKVGKPELKEILYFPTSMGMLSKIREWAEEKYPNKDSFKECDTEDLLSATLRHLFKHHSDEFDEESGHPHLGHALVNICMMIEIEYGCKVHDFMQDNDEWDDTKGYDK